MFSRRSREFKSGESRFSTGSDSDSRIDDLGAVETSLREGLTLNNEEARALLGRIEFQKGNFDSTLQILEGIEVDNVFPRVKLFVPPKNKQKKGRIRSSDMLSRRSDIATQPLTIPSATLLLEAIYLKVMALENLGRSSDAAQLCHFLIESFDQTFPTGLPDHLAETKIQEHFNKVLEFLPRFLEQQGLYADAILSYRRALRSRWEPGSKLLHSLRLGLAILLLYSGVESPPCPIGIYGNNFVPENNIEESIRLLIDSAMVSTSKASWCPEVMEHLCFALSTSGHFAALAKQYEGVLPGIYSRSDRWISLGLCYSAAGDNNSALNLLKKSLAAVEKPDDVFSLLLAASICSASPRLASEGIGFGKKAIEIATSSDGMGSFLRGKAWQVLGIALSTKARSAASSSERSGIVREALSAWHEASKLDRIDPKTLLHFGLIHAEEGNLKVAIKSAKKFLESSSSSSTGWRFLALVLSAQQRFYDSEMVIDAGLREVDSWDQGELCLTKAKLQVAQGRHLEAMETYKMLLVLSAEKKTSVSELRVWQEMAAVFTSLSQWSDASTCLEKAKLLDMASAETWYGYGLLSMAQSKNDEAMAAFETALTCDPEHVPSKVQIGAVLIRSATGNGGGGGGGKSLSVARSFLNDALRFDPRNPLAWFHLGSIHEIEGRLEQAADCFHTAYVLDQSRPVESFGSLLKDRDL